ncbi:MAG: hypothetical protein GF417_05615 [Candidatus Latescibacteria bacterium]|nr:hypothetical protein [bacterium]MBD3423893.1 hypothetical protein [Candidatus Latescibacterota bacterium]
MGGTRNQFQGEASSGFLNPAAIGAGSLPVLYADYFTTGGVSGFTGAAEINPFSRLNLSFMGRRSEGGVAVYGMGIAGQLLSGAPDTYLNIGGAARLVNGLEKGQERCAVCGENGGSGAETGAFSAGVIFRPFPSFSLRYIGEWALDSGYHQLFEGSDYHRVGISFYFLPGLMISLEREFREELTLDHFGFNLRTGLPLEIMTGYSNGSVSGGVRLAWKAIRASAVFSQDEGDGIRTRVSMEFSPELDGRRVE